MRRFASKGYVRNQLLVVNGGAANGTTGMSVGTVTQSSTTVTASGVSQELAGSTGSAEAYAVEATVVRQVDSRLERVREARMKGYEGDSCGECGNFTLVRNGTCLKCATCGGTSGCSRSEEHTSELQHLMRISSAVLCLHKKHTQHN